jgi:hypothetical protein
MPVGGIKMKLIIDKNWKVGDIIDIRGSSCTIVSKKKANETQWEYEVKFNTFR